MELFMEGILKSGHHIGQEDRSSRSSNSGGSISMSERTRMLDITRDKPIKVAVRVAVPVRDHPKFNFVGKLLGPKGNSMKRLQEETMCKMAILGRGSMKDRKKEEELRSSGDPRYAHLLDDLHVEISTFAAPAEAHARIAYALAEVRRFLVPDYHDDIRQEQMWEMQTLTTTQNQNEDTNNITNEGINTDLHNNNNNNNNIYNNNNIDEKIINGNESILNCCNVHNNNNNNNNNNTLQVELGLANSLASGVINEVTCNESIIPMQSNEGESQTVTLLETPGALLHPALRGIKTFNIVSLNCNQKAGNTARKRPLLSSPRPMNPTKRTVMTLLARAKNSQVLHAAKIGVGHHPVTESMLIASPLVLQQTIDGITHNIPVETSTALSKENILQGA